MIQSAVSTGQLWRYSVLAIPIAFAGFPLYVLAPDYYATKHGVSLSLLGAMLLALRLFDAVQDPLIGALSDRYRRASIWVMGGASVVLCVAIYGLFNAMPVHPAVWFGFCVAVAVSAYSVRSIHLNALGSLWTKDSALQTRITALREACGLVGLVIAVSLPSLLQKMVDEQQAYVYFSMILCGVMMLAWLAFWPWLVTHAGGAAPATSQLDISGIFSLPGATKTFLALYALSMLASSIPAVLVIFFVRDLLGAESMIGPCLLLYFIAGALSMPVWRRLSVRFGKYQAWLMAMLLAVITFIWAFFLQSGDVWLYAWVCVLSGLALGADLALPPSILADHIHHAHAEERAASQYALLALAAKLSLALASAIALPTLGMAGFKPGEENSASALLYLSIAYALIPCLLKLSAGMWLWRRFISINQGGIHENPYSNRISGSSHHA